MSATVGELKQKVYEAVDRHMSEGGCVGRVPEEFWCVACKTSMAIIFEKHGENWSEDKS